MDLFRCEFCGYEFIEDRYMVTHDSCPRCGKAGMKLQPKPKKKGDKK